MKRKIDSQKVLAEVRANLDRLYACKGPHQFPPDSTWTPRVQCALCGGWLDRVQAHWYQRGVEHGSRDADAS